MSVPIPLRRDSMILRACFRIGRLRGSVLGHKGLRYLTEGRFRVER
jgi:hypothetical protein